MDHEDAMELNRGLDATNKHLSMIASELGRIADSWEEFLEDEQGGEQEVYTCILCGYQVTEADLFIDHLKEAHQAQETIR
jgi:hypothetical protein